jgi:hypothetical protein
MRWSAIASCVLEQTDQVVADALVEVLAPEIGVAVGAAHLEDAIGDLEDRDVEGPATEVEDGDASVAVLVESVGECRGGRLVEDAQHVQARDAAGVLGGLALGVVEVGRDGDHRVLDGLSQEVCGGLAHLGEHHRGDLLR